ncbi:MAG: hypothetical protein ACOY82_05655 [Pseudomonadota bacterium]
MTRSRPAISAKNRLPLLAVGIAIGLTSLGVFAYRELLPAVDALPIEEAFSMDLPMTAEAASMRIENTVPTQPNPWGVTHEMVGEADSFGRDSVYLGAMAGHIALSATCPRSNPMPGEQCQVIGTNNGVTRFDFRNIAEMRLPAASANALLCQWLTPIVSINYRNGTSVRAAGTLYYAPTVTVLNPALNDPALINPLTGRPFNGALTTGLSSQERLSMPLEPGFAIAEQTRKSSVCVAGMVSRSRLIQVYGLSEAEADRFLASPMTLQFNVSGFSQYVDLAVLSLNMRLMGDARM